jgi:hypothetical protein
MTSETVHALVGKSLKSRAIVANALCAVAEEEFHAGQLMRAAETVRTIRHVLADINLFLSGDTTYLHHGTLREVAEALAGLDDRIAAMEAAIRMHMIH